MATDIFGDYEDQERLYGEIEVDPPSSVPTIRELTERAVADIRDSMNILNVEEHVYDEEAYDLAKMVVEHRMRVMGERY